MRLLLTGAAGMLGGDLLVAAERRGLAVVGLTHAELDITDAAAVHLTIEAAAPQAIVNCAAWNDVDGAEADDTAALALNRDGPANLADAADAAGARLVHVSTDYVFAGTADRPYVESDPTCPRTAYGASKLAGERAVLARAGEHVVARTAWLFGKRRSNFVAWVLDSAAAGRPVEAFTDQVGCPTYTVHLAERLLELAAGDRRGVFHEAAAGHCSRFELAQAVIAASGRPGVVTPATRSSRAAPRPAWSVLASERDEPLPRWQEGLDAYLAAVGTPV